MIRTILEDLDAVLANDPASSSRLEAALVHSPFHAILIYRLAHFLLAELSVRLLPRVLSNFARAFTGVEIHPAACIGRRFFIDHGTGVVIGETAEIGDDCVLFHNVTLGGTGKHTGKRHPTLRDRVFVGTGATLLGPLTVGSDVKIGAQSFLRMRDVPPGCTVVGAPARLVKEHGVRVDRELERTGDPN